MGANPKTVILCITLFLGSALITLSLKSTHHRPGSPQTGSNYRLPILRFPSSVPSPSHPNKKDRPAVQQSQHSPKVAYATFLAANANPGREPTDDASAAIEDNDDGYFLGTRVMIYQLLHSKTAGTNNSIPFLVMCTDDVSPRKRARLEADGATVIVVEKLHADWVTPGDSRWADVLTKLRLFELTQYQKLCFIDADHLITASLDGVFFDEATLTQPTLTNGAEIKDDEGALPRTYMFATHADLFGYNHPYPPEADLSYLNCGFFVFTPSLVLFNFYVSLLKLNGRFDPAFPEQNLLNYAHRREGAMPWKPLWYGWNVNWPTVNDWRGGARSFHAKYWDSDPSHDPFLKAMWQRQHSEMKGFWRGRDSLKA